jgi:hypothetical protein
LEWKHQPASQQTKTFLHYYETNKEAVDQTDAEKRADLFRVHLLRRRGLMTEVAPLQLGQKLRRIHSARLDQALVHGSDSTWMRVT